MTLPPQQPSSPPAPPPFGPRLAVGMVGVLIAAMMAGLNNRVGGLGVPDIRGSLGWGADEASWLDTVYSAGEVVAMPFTAWFSITFSQRRFQLVVLSLVICIATVLPWVRDLHLLVGLRAVQGVCSGALIPLLMMSALRYLPPSIRLHGMALYALTATFAPNVALGLGALWLDQLHDWRWVYWHVIPIAVLSMPLIAWGIPSMPPALHRFRQADWLGFGLGGIGLSLLMVGLTQGERLDWFNSPLIIGSLAGGALTTGLFLVSEWFHEAPFIKLQILGRRNIGLGFTIFLLMLIAMSSAVALPANSLARLQNFRLLQTAPIGLLVGIPQLILGPLVALLLYRKWIDARYVFVLGLICIAAACYFGTQFTSEWMVSELATALFLQTVGQPMAMVSLLFLMTSVVHPMEGPYVAGMVNTIRAIGSASGGVVVSRLMTLRGDFHREMLIDQLGLHQPTLSHIDLTQIAQVIGQQATVLATADVYRILGLLAVGLVPLVFCLNHVPAPKLPQNPVSISK